MSYIAGCTEAGEAVVVDACHDINLYLDILRDQKLKLKYLVETHTQADHDTLAGALSEKTGAPVAMHRNYTRQRALGAGFQQMKRLPGTWPLTPLWLLTWCWITDQPCRWAILQ